MGRRPADRSLPAKDIARWLAGNPGLDAARDRFPQEWSRVRREVVNAAALDGPEGVAQYLRALEAGATTQAQVTRYLAAELIRQMSLAAATGLDQGTVKFRHVDGTILQQLFFAEGLTRKPANDRLVRAVWRLVPQRRYLMPLVERQGIYCFYSKRLIDGLVGLIGSRRCVELAAGDGTLSRFLVARGVDVVPTDDRSWSSVIRYPDSVRQLDARRALRSLTPQSVLCSWPPSANRFEEQIFKTASVQQYVVIGSRHRFATGNRHAYADQTVFDETVDHRLSRLVLPRELECEVRVFTRRASA